MKNKRKLAVISLVVMMMVTAVGYAAFSDSLKVEGTASNAKFDVQFVEPNVSGEYVSVLANSKSLVGGGHGGPGGPGGGYNDPYDKGDTVHVTVSNLIPGETATATGHIKNLGSVYAYLQGAASITKNTQNYTMTLQLPEVLGYTSADNTGEYFLTVTMKSSIEEKDGVDAGKYTDECDFVFSYQQ